MRAIYVDMDAHPLERRRDCIGIKISFSDVGAPSAH